MIGRTWRRLCVLASRRERGTALALFRIGIGLTVFITVASIVGRGLVELLFVDQGAGGWFALKTPWPMRLLGGPSTTATWILVSTTLVASAAMSVGAGGRAFRVLTLFGWIGLMKSFPEAGGSFDALLSNALWLCVLADCSATLSVYCRRRTGRWTNDRRVPAWPRYLAVLQMIVMYASAGAHKLSAHWIPGGDHAALYYILQWPAWVRFDPAWLSWGFALTLAMTLATWCFEITAPLWLLAIWFDATASRPGRLRKWSNRLRLRWWYFGFGIALHLGTWLLLEVGPFSPAALSFYACMLSPAVAERMVHAARPRDR